MCWMSAAAFCMQTKWNETKRRWNSWIILWQKISPYQIKVPSYTHFNVVAYIRCTKYSMQTKRTTAKKVRNETRCDRIALNEYEYECARVWYNLPKQSLFANYLRNSLKTAKRAIDSTTKLPTVDVCVRVWLRCENFTVLFIPLPELTPN